MKKYKRLSDMYLAGTGYKVVYTERGYEIAKDGKIVDGVWRDRKSAEDFLAVSVMLGLM